MKKNILLFLFLIVPIAFSACKDNEESNSILNYYNEIKAGNKKVLKLIEKKAASYYSCDDICDRPPDEYYEARAFFEETDENNQNIIFKALQNNDLEMVKILSKYGVLVKSEECTNYYNLLEYSIFLQNVPSVEFFLSSEFDGVFEIGLYTKSFEIIKESKNKEIEKLYLNKYYNKISYDKQNFSRDLNEKNSSLIYSIENDYLDSKLKKIIFDYFAALSDDYFPVEKNLEILKLLIKHNVDVNKPVPSINVLLRIENEKIFDFLLEQNFDLNYVDENNGTILTKFVENKKSDFEKLKKLIRHGANPDIGVTKNNLCVLSQTISNKNTEFAKFLIENGASVNPKSQTTSPLMIACESKNFDLIKLLVEKGADVNYKTKYESSCLLTILKYYHSNPQMHEIAKLFIEHGANVNEKTEEGRTPLMYLVMENNYELIELLNSHSADFKACDKDGQNAFHYFMMRKRFWGKNSNNFDDSTDQKIKDLLLLKKVDLNKKNSEGLTPMDLDKRLNY